VVTDEQHRFGVAQRSALSAKGDSPHMLVMSATPIPRTLALILYGDLDVSVIDELPPGRQKIDTFAVPGSYHPRLYADFILRKPGRRGPAELRGLPHGGGGRGRPGRAQGRDGVRRRPAAPGPCPTLRVAVVHGKMKPREKDAVMAAFAAHETDVLVSTTVIEVGVDVPNATVMVVENAERFGLSQLHQLRGRVGRGTPTSPTAC
jgi:ATP-dependent DNA helicase RecG